MSENPQRENGHIDIANEIAEAMARINLTAHETRFLWCLFRKTYGWQKKEDWISLSQVSEMTGMHKSHASRAKRLLILRNMVTPRGNKIGFNKYFSQWKELPHGVNRHDKLTKVTPRGNLPPAPRGNRELPHGAPQKTTYTKDTITNKTVLEKKPDTADPGERERRFKALLVQQGWCDQSYADKTWEQGMGMSARAEFVRKVNLMLGWSRIPAKLERARLLFHEISGFVNDQGAMQQRLSPQEITARAIFREETGQDLEAA